MDEELVKHAVARALGDLGNSGAKPLDVASDAALMKALGVPERHWYEEAVGRWVRRNLERACDAITGTGYVRGLRYSAEDLQEASTFLLALFGESGGCELRYWQVVRTLKLVRMKPSTLRRSSIRTEILLPLSEQLLRLSRESDVGRVV